MRPVLPSEVKVLVQRIGLIEAKRLVQRIKRLEAENSVLARRMERTQKQTKTLKLDFSAAKVRIRGLETRVRDLEVKIGNFVYREELDSLRVKGGELEAEMRELRAKLASAEATIRNLQYHANL